MAAAKVKFVGQKGMPNVDPVWNYIKFLGVADKFEYVEVNILPDDANPAGAVRADAKPKNVYGAIPWMEFADGTVVSESNSVWLVSDCAEWCQSGIGWLRLVFDGSLYRPMPACTSLCRSYALLSDDPGWHRMAQAPTRMMLAVIGGQPLPSYVGYLMTPAIMEYADHITELEIDPQQRAVNRMWNDRLEKTVTEDGLQVFRTARAMRDEYGSAVAEAIDLKVGLPVSPCVSISRCLLS
eukprot:gene16025-4854_t